MPDVSFKDLCIDVTEGDGRPAAAANFWGTALGQEVVAHDDGSFHLAPPDGASKNRVVWINPVLAAEKRVAVNAVLADL